MALLPVGGGPRQQPASRYAGNAFEPSGCIFRTPRSLTSRAYEMEAAQASRQAQSPSDQVPI
jgi:hypothetical protein